jgi:hypothetical protein
MSIKWGTDLSGVPPTLLTATAAADVTCTADATVTALSAGGAAGALAQATNQDFIARISGVMTFVLGASAPTALTITYATTAGTPIDTYVVEPGLLVDSAEIVIPIYLLGVSSSSLFAGAGATPLVQVLSATNPCTLKAIGSRAIFSMGLGND